MPLSGTMWSVDTNCNSLHFLLLLYAWTFRFGFNEHCLNIQISIQWKLPKYSDSMKTGRTFRFGFNENRLTAIRGPMWSVDTLSLLSSRLSADIWLHRNTSKLSSRQNYHHDNDNANDPDHEYQLYFFDFNHNVVLNYISKRWCFSQFVNSWPPSGKGNKFFYDTIASHPSSLQIRVGVPKNISFK